MNKIFLQITKQFDYLLSHGLQFTYSETTGKLGDRSIQIFSYENTMLNRRFELVYCNFGQLQNLFAFIVKYSKDDQNPKNVKDNISFDRLRCFFEDGDNIIFFGIKQYDFLYKLGEIRLVLDKFLDCIITERWIDYEELLANEKKIYVLTLEPKNNYLWANEIKSFDFIQKSTTVIYDSSQEPSYEAYGLRLKSKNGIIFHITHGYKSRDDVGYGLQIIRQNNETENHEFFNEGTKSLIEFIQQTIIGG